MYLMIAVESVRYYFDAFLYTVRSLSWWLRLPWLDFKNFGIEWQPCIKHGTFTKWCVKRSLIMTSVSPSRGSRDRKGRGLRKMTMRSDAVSVFYLWEWLGISSQWLLKKHVAVGWSKKECCDPIILKVVIIMIRRQVGKQCYVKCSHNMPISSS